MTVKDRILYFINSTVNSNKYRRLVEEERFEEINTVITDTRQAMTALRDILIETYGTRENNLPHN